MKLNLEEIKEEEEIDSINDLSKKYKIKKNQHQNRIK
jgi:hypothetical protein